jgi:hypothetical protein
MFTELFSLLLSGLYVLGLLLLPFYWFAHSPAARRWLFWLALVLINLGGLWYLLISFLVTRLNGSTPPSLGQAFLQGLWIPVLILVLSNAVLFTIRARKTHLP